MVTRKIYWVGYKTVTNPRLLQNGNRNCVISPKLLQYGYNSLQYCHKVLQFVVRYDIMSTTKTKGNAHPCGD